MNIIKKIENYINTNPDLKFFFRYLTYVVFLNIWIFFNINFLGDLLIVYFLKYNIVIDDYFNLYMIILLILVSLRLLYLFLSNIFVFWTQRDLEEINFINQSKIYELELQNNFLKQKLWQIKE